MITLTLMLAILVVVASVMFVLDRWARASRRRERENARKLHRYLASLPPSRPW